MSGIVRGGWESGSSECDIDEEENGIEPIDLRDMSRLFEETEMAEVICDDQAEQNGDVDLPEVVTVEDSQTDPRGGSVRGFINLLELKELQNIPVEGTSSSDTEDVSPYEPVEPTQEPQSTHAEQGLNDPIDIEMDLIPQSFPKNQVTAISYLGRRISIKRNC